MTVLCCLLKHRPYVVVGKIRMSFIKKKLYYFKMTIYHCFVKCSFTQTVLQVDITYT